MKTFFCVLSFLLVFNCVHAQSIKWGPSKKVRGTFSMIGERENDVVLSFYELKGFLGLGGASPSILTYDKSCNVKEKIVLNKIIENEHLIVDVAIKGNNYQGLAFNNLLNEKEKTLFKIDFDNKKEINREEILTIPKGYMMKLVHPEMRPNSYKKAFELFYSNERSKMAILTFDKKKNINTADLTIIDRNDEFKIISEIDLNIKNRSNFIRIVDKKVKKDGTVLLLIKNYKSKKEKEKAKGAPNYSFKGYTIKKGQVNTYDIPSQEVFTKDATIKTDKEGNVYIISLYEEKYKKGAKGISIVKFDMSGKELFSKSFESKSLRKGKKQLNKHFSLRGAILVDGVFMINSQLIEFESKTDSNSGRQTENYLSKDIIFDGINIDGEYLWSKRIVRNDYSPVFEYLTNTNYYNSDGVVIFLNTHRNSIADLEKDKIRARKVPSKKNHIMKLTVKKDGTYNYEDVSSTNGMTVFNSMFGDVTGDFYFLGVTPKFKFSFGRLDQN